MIAATRIPTHRNDGSKVSKRELKAILKRVREKFRGYSLDDPADGAWIADDGKVYEEQSRKLEVVVSAERVNEARELFLDMGRQLGQRAIFLKFARAGRSLTSTNQRTKHAENDGQRKLSSTAGARASTRSHAWTNMG